MQEDFTIKLGLMFHFTTRDPNLLKTKSTQAYDMTVLQRYCNVGSTYCSVIIIFILSIALYKNRFQGNVSGVMHRTSLMRSISVIGFTIYVYFQSGINNKYSCCQCYCCCFI